MVESPNTAFKVLFTRFIEGIVVYPSLRYHVMLITCLHHSFQLHIYDNGCNLHSYILNREPHFLRRHSF